MAQRRRSLASNRYRTEEMPPGVLASYEIQLDDDPPGWTTYVVPDSDSIIRRPLPRKTVVLRVPPGFHGGQTVVVQGPTGPFRIQIPHGLVPGQQFRVTLVCSDSTQPAAGAGGSTSSALQEHSHGHDRRHDDFQPPTKAQKLPESVPDEADVQ